MSIVANEYFSQLCASFQSEQSIFLIVVNLFYWFINIHELLKMHFGQKEIRLSVMGIVMDIVMDMNIMLYRMVAKNTIIVINDTIMMMHYL